ncbi:thioredoxin-like 7 family protein [Tripterygium wilfordii]|uniref:Thioredoxin-like 7 family protein n=1 Tax=Tripterygium wilfordii TaxID=458696 RepID=A0A7J7DS49_TRIWF|nr:thioredoxin-like 1-1, chloroplastic [Tripterygium wilfordii]KAF5749190.1 thioredoxin-like 7 family protein [Tripterygium wilfordii]
MATEVLGKANLLASTHKYNPDQRKNGVPGLAKNCNFRGFSSPKVRPLRCLGSQTVSFLHSDFQGKRVIRWGNQGKPKRGKFQVSISSQSGLIGKAHKWWEKGLRPNMKEVTSAQDLVDSLLNAGDKLVIVDFFSPGCGGCKALHPKICQFAEMNPDIQFLQVNYEEHKSMCYSLHIHVLPFLRFYRGADGRVCSFSCTNATIKKFKDALAKYNTDSVSIGPAKGLEEKELVALAANKDLNFTYTPKADPPEAPRELEKVPAEVGFSHSDSKIPTHLPSKAVNSPKDIEGKTLVTAGR